jgi:hypothetical protein
MIRVVVNLDMSGQKWGIYAIIKQGVWLQFLPCVVSFWVVEKVFVENGFG